MNPDEIVQQFSRLGIHLRAEDGRLIARPLSRVPPELRKLVRANEQALLAHLGSPAPDSRHPLIKPEIRAKIMATEMKARRLGWPPELLWNAAFWDYPRGLAAVLDAEDEIVEVSADSITILKRKRDVLRFRRHVT